MPGNIFDIIEKFRSGEILTDTLTSYMKNSIKA